MAWDNIISRGVWLILQPSNFLLLLMITGFLLQKVTHKNSKLRIYSRRMIRISVSLLLLFGFTNIPSWALWPLEGRFSSYTNQLTNGPYSGIIVLAGSEEMSVSTAHDQANLKIAGDRLAQAAKLALDYPALAIIHSGGTRKAADEWSENDVAERFFSNMNIEPERIRYDRKSYNTRTNALESKKLIQPLESEKWLLVTSAFHMPRSVGAFRKADVNIQPYPVDYMTTLKYDGLFSLDVSRNLTRLDFAVHEYIGLLAYYITARSSELFPAP